MNLGHSVSLGAGKSFKYSKLSIFNFHFGQVSNVLMPVQNRKYVYIGSEYVRNGKLSCWVFRFIDTVCLLDEVFNYEHGTRSNKVYPCHEINIVRESTVVINKERIERVCKRHNIGCGPLGDVDNVKAEKYGFERYAVMACDDENKFTSFVTLALASLSKYDKYPNITEYIRCNNKIDDKALKKLSLLGANEHIIVDRNRIYSIAAKKAYAFADVHNGLSERNSSACNLKSGCIVNDSIFTDIASLKSKAAFILDTIFDGCEIFINEPCIIYNNYLLTGTKFSKCIIHVNAPCLFYKCKFNNCKLEINSDIVAHGCGIENLEITCKDGERHEIRE